MTVSKYLYLSILALTFFIYSCESNDSIVAIKTDTTKSAKSKVLVELFTNTSCVPCVATNNYIDGIMNHTGVTYNDDSVIIIRVHSSVFNGDPFYLFNQPVNNARQQFYNAWISNPRTFLDGTLLGTTLNIPVFTAAINARLLLSNNFNISVNTTYDTSTRNVSLDMEVGQITGDTARSDIVLHAAVLENGLYYQGSNGETNFDNVMRDLATGVNGQALTISPGQLADIDNNFTLMTGINPANVDIVVFVQSTTTKEVLGVTKKKLL